MKISRNIKTADLIDALHRCFDVTSENSCIGCPMNRVECIVPYCSQLIAAEAARRLEEYTDRCARYAEEIAVLKAASKSNEGGLSVEKLIYEFTVNHDGKLVIAAETNDDNGRILKIAAYDANGVQRSVGSMLAHASAPTEHEVDELRSCLKESIADVVTLEEGK